MVGSEYFVHLWHEAVWNDKNVPICMKFVTIIAKDRCPCSCNKNNVSCCLHMNLCYPSLGCLPIILLPYRHAYAYHQELQLWYADFRSPMRISRWTCLHRNISGGFQKFAKFLCPLAQNQTSPSHKDLCASSSTLCSFESLDINRAAEGPTPGCQFPWEPFT